MKILVTGANGQVGQELLSTTLINKYSVNVVGLDKQALDITNFEHVLSTLSSQKPDVVINSAAYTAVDKAEDDIDLAYSINAKGPENLAKACKILNIPLLHISTDYVFDGNKPESYLETDIPNPSGIYGKSKLAGEQAIQNIHSMHYILRVAWVFGEHGNNFVKTMLRLGKERSELSIVADQKGCPTWAKDIAETLIKLAIQTAQQPIEWGIYHFTGDNETTWHGFAQQIFDSALVNSSLTNKPTLQGITSEQYPTPAKRPLNSTLNCNKIKRALNIEQSNWLFGLNHVLKTWKQ